ncbi:DUF4097 family beta strand repeat-containing protein [Emticicia agri]|uniref:DUF4097 domain-containing protein n=1 Tax=Emticicia agri TaxID=2492393 RepID=A0A4Q5M590_9BACT|nr:DUF4097 family beta strand repeat-containing protein [Emticicia agri]RYU97083.1 hypothetical protein EWM59_04020 [Emticicia agri]
MKNSKAIIAVLVLMTISIITPAFAQNEIKEQLVVPLSDPAKSGTLHVGLINGSIKVTGYAGKEVVIDAETTPVTNRKERVDESASGMKRITPRGGLELSAEEKNNKVNVNSSSHRQPVNLSIKVPQQFSLKVSTVNHGDIVIENVTGELEINNVNGDITMTNVAGSAVANTVNGVIKANFKTVTDSPMAFTTLNGNIDITFPTTVKMNAKVKSDRGEVYSDFDMDIDKSAPKGVRSNQNGMYKVSIDEWIQGKVNGGGSEVMMKNMHGNIYIRKAK